MPYTLSRPFVAPPGLPDDRAKALQSAFLDMQKDPDYLAEVAKMQIDVSPIDGPTVGAHRTSQPAPPELLDTMRKLHADSKGGGQVRPRGCPASRSFAALSRMFSTSGLSCVVSLRRKKMRRRPRVRKKHNIF